MTSNIGSDHILDVAGDDSKYEQMRTRVFDALKGHFRPEFLNRVDDTILFHTLDRTQLRDIVTIQLRRVEKLLEDQKIGIQLSDAALDHIVEAGYDPVYGARPLKRAIQRELENPIATKLLENTFTMGDTIYVDWQQNGLTLSPAAPPAPTNAESDTTPPEVEDDSAPPEVEDKSAPPEVEDKSAPPEIEDKSAPPKTKPAKVAVNTTG